MEQLKHGKCSQTEIALHTHDLIAYRSCRRKHQFSSPFGLHLKPKASALGVSGPLWFGSGIHFALEDYHGDRRFDTPAETFKAYSEAFLPEETPYKYDEFQELGPSMLEYYLEWDAAHANYTTAILDGKPLVEVPFSLVLEPLCYHKLTDEARIGRYPELAEVRVIFDGDQYFDSYGYCWDDENVERVEIVYHGTIDRVVEDLKGDWWILDYKTAAAFDTAKLALDPQVTAYCWAAEQWFGREIMGMVYIQMSKNPPKAPKMTTKGLSADKSQRTTPAAYEAKIVELYGSLQKAPDKYLTCLEHLYSYEEETGNRFLQCHWVERSQASKRRYYEYTIQAGREILNPETPRFPTPTKDCEHMCSFKDVCITMEDDADWEYLLSNYEVREETMKDEVPKWMKRLWKNHPDKYPEEVKTLKNIAPDSVEAFADKYEED